MKRFDFRILVGVLLIIGGALSLLDVLGILKGVTDLFWAGVFALGAVIFLIWFFTDRHRWWAAIPGFALAGLAISNLLPNQAGWGSLAFLGGLGGGFFAVYFSNHRQWWAIIPAGILITLGINSALTSVFSLADTGGLFLIGLGLTFLLVALLARMRWAYIPAAVLFLVGFFVGTPFTGIYQYAWIGLLILLGLILIASSLRR